MPGITTNPNVMVAAVHNRMPVILSPEHYQWWLEAKRIELEFLKTLLRPYLGSASRRSEIC